MLRSIDAEELTSIAVSFIAVSLILGLLIERTNIHSQGIRYGSIIAGGIVIIYGIGGVLYILMTNNPEIE